MGQENCRCSDRHTRTSRVPKCSLLDQELLSSYNLANKENYDQTFHSSRYFDCEPSKLPAKYTDLYMILRSYDRKYSDIYFPAEQWAIKASSSVDQPEDEEKWRRLSEYLGERTAPLIIGKISKFCTLIKFIQSTYPLLFDQIRPIYVQSVGFAVCQLYICGRQSEVIVDDQIPLSKFSYSANKQALLLEKAFAKVLGSYEHIEAFSIGEIFSELTGIPYTLNNQLSLNTKPDAKGPKFYCFKDALKCDQVLYQSEQFKNQKSVLGYQENFAVQSISFSGAICWIKINNPTRQDLSLRIVQRNQKYEESFIKGIYPHLFAELIHPEQEPPLKSTYRFDNCTYIGGNFTELKAGVSWVYVRQFANPTTLSLVAYCKKSIKLSEVYDSASLTPLPFKMVRTLFPYSGLKYKQIATGVSASLIEFDAKLAINFKNNYPNKTLKTTASTLYLQVEGKEDRSQCRSISLKETMGKWIFILSCIQPFDSRGSFQILEN